MTDSPHSIAVTDKLLRDFALVLSGGLTLIFGLLLPWIWGWSYPLWPWLTAAILALAGFLAPRILTPIFKGWMRLGHVLGWINTRLILGILFYVVILPFGFVMRLFGKDPMARQIRADIKSYRVPSRESSPEDLKRPF